MSKLSCPSCSKPFKTGPQHAGKRVKCPACGAVVAVPAGEASPAPAASRPVRPIVSRQPQEQPKAKGRQPLVLASALVLFAVAGAILWINREPVPQATPPQVAATPASPSSAALPTAPPNKDAADPAGSGSRGFTQPPVPVAPEPPVIPQVPEPPAPPPISTADKSFDELIAAGDKAFRQMDLANAKACFTAALEHESAKDPAGGRRGVALSWLAHFEFNTGVPNAYEKNEQAIAILKEKRSDHFDEFARSNIQYWEPRGWDNKDAAGAIDVTILRAARALGKVNTTYFVYGSVVAGRCRAEEGEMSEAWSFVRGAIGSGASYRTELDPMAGPVLIHAAAVHRIGGEYESALDLIDIALDRLKLEYSERHPAFAQAQVEKGLLLAAQGKHEQALDFLRRGTTSLERCGAGHPDANRGQIALGKTLLALNRHAEAHQVWVKAVAGFERRTTQQKLDRIENLGHLGDALFHLGRIEEALPHYEEAFKWSREFMQFRLSMARRLSEAHLRLKNYDKASGVYEVLLGAPDAGKNVELDPGVAPFMESGGFVVKVGEGGEAPTTRQSMKIIGSDFDYTWANTALVEARARLADIYRQAGRTADAAAIDAQVATLRAKRLEAGIADPARPFILNAESHFFRGDNVAAFEELAKVVPIRSRWHRQVIDALPEQEKFAFVRRDAQLWYLILSNAVAVRGIVPDADCVAMDAYLALKGSASDSIRRQTHLAAQSNDPNVRRAAQEMAQARGKLSQLLLDEPDSANPTREPQKIRDLEAQVRRLESEMAAASSAIAGVQREETATWQTLAKAIPPDATFLAFLEVPDLSQLASVGTRVYYIALTQKHGQKPRLHLIGRNGVVDYYVLRLRERLQSPNGPTTGDESLGAARWWLASRMLPPLWPQLVDSKRLIIAGAGRVATVPFSILPRLGERGESALIDHFEILNVNSGLDLLAMGQPRARDGDAVIVANPDFDRAARGAKEADVRQRAVSRLLKDSNWSPLPGTQAEASAIIKRLRAAGIKATALTGPAATKQAVLAVKSPRILHLATHGYFISHPSMGRSAHPLLDWQYFVDDEGIPHPTARNPVNPLIFSGLALAGANQDANRQAGILTAFEIRAMNLLGTDVILSACETGLGGTSAADSVRGLQSSIQQAGARSVTMSLWSVPDKETAQLMDYYYERMLAGDDLAKALRAAMLRLRDERRAEGKSDHPYYWAAFAVHGDPG